MIENQQTNLITRKKKTTELIQMLLISLEWSVTY